MVHCTIETVDYALGRPCTSSFSGRPGVCPKRYRTLSEFVARMVYRSQVKVPVLLVAIVYIERVKAHLKISVDQWACVRVFVGALVLAGKYLTDYPITNIKWARWSGVFRPNLIGHMERELLRVLDWDLAICENDILAHHEHITSSYRPSIRSQSSPTSTMTKLSKRPRSASPSSDRNSSPSTSYTSISSPSSSSALSAPYSSSPSVSPPFALVKSSYHPTFDSCVRELVDVRPAKRMRLFSNSVQLIPPYPPLPTHSSAMSSFCLPKSQIQTNTHIRFVSPLESFLWA